MFCVYSLLSVKVRTQRYYTDITDSLGERKAERRETDEHPVRVIPALCRWNRAPVQSALNGKRWTRIRARRFERVPTQDTIRSVVRQVLSSVNTSTEWAWGRISLRRRAWNPRETDRKTNKSTCFNLVHLRVSYSEYIRHVLGCSTWGLEFEPYKCKFLKGHWSGSS